MSFSELNLGSDLLQAIADLGYQVPTPIQHDAIPPALIGRDVLACAMTGSGKTAAFLLPILQRLQARPRGTTRALVLVPTRELAAQVHEALEALGRHTGIRGAAVFGGVGIGPQEEAFKSGVDVLIATPGRLLDHFQYDYAALAGLEVLVLDEADRMLDMGFLPDIRRVLKHLPKPQQTMLFSATMPREIVDLSQDLLRDPARINVERQAAPATGITQGVFLVREDLKPSFLLEMLRRGEIESAIVFTRTKHRANRLAEYLQKHGISCDRIHGNRSQAQRTEALGKFKDGKTRVMVATDIVARGIDVEELSHVINFDVPQVPEDYIHRVGRTARAEATGEAFTLVSDEDMQNLRAIERTIGRQLQRRTLTGFDYQAPAGEPLEIPLQERIAQIRARKSEERARAKEKAERKAQRVAEEQSRQGGGRGPSRPAVGNGQPQGQRAGAPGNGNGNGNAPGNGRSRGRRHRSRPGNGGGSGAPRPHRPAANFAPEAPVSRPQLPPSDDWQPTTNAHPHYVGVFTGRLANEEEVDPMPALDRRPFGRRGQKPAEILPMSGKGRRR